MRTSMCKCSDKNKKPTLSSSTLQYHLALTYVTEFWWVPDHHLSSLLNMFPKRMVELFRTAKEKQKSEIWSCVEDQKQETPVCQGIENQTDSLTCCLLTSEQDSDYVSTSFFRPARRPPTQWPWCSIKILKKCSFWVHSANITHWATITHGGNK